MADTYTDPDVYDLGHINGSNAERGFMLSQSTTAGAGYNTPQGMIASITGWAATEILTGPPGATTYIVSGGANNSNAYDQWERQSDPARTIPGSNTIQTETIMGKGEHNTAVLRGRPEDYHITMPANIDEYHDSKKFGKEGAPVPNQYGDRIKLEDVTTGRPYTLTGIDRVVFVPYEDTAVSHENNMGLFLDKSEITALEDGIKTGQYPSMTQAEMVAQAESGMSPQEKVDTRLLGSPEAARLHSESREPNTPEGSIRATEQTLATLNEKIGEQIMDRPVELNNAPPTVTFSAPAAPAPAMDLRNAPGMGQ